METVEENITFQRKAEEAQCKLQFKTSAWFECVKGLQQC